MNPAEVMRRLADAVQRRDADALAALYAEDAVLCHPLAPMPLVGRQAIRESEQALFDAFSDIEVEVKTLLADDRCCGAELVIRATNSGPIDLGSDEPVPASGRHVELPSAWFLELGPDGLVVAERDYLDTAMFLRQLGLAG